MSKGIPRVVIADLDERYAIHLEQKFLEVLRDRVDLEVITDADYLQRYFSRANDIDVLLISENLYSDDLTRHDIAQCFVLTGEESRAQSADEGATYIYKYTNPTQVFKQTMHEVVRPAAHAGGQRKGKIIVSYSPVGGCGKSTIAAGVACALAQGGAKVLFVDLEYQQEFSSLFPGVGTASRQLAMRLAEPQGDVYTAALPLIVPASIDVLPPLRGNILTYGLDLTPYLQFVAQAKASEVYDYVVVDTDSTFNMEKSTLVAAADAVVVAVPDDLHGHRMCSMFRQGLDADGGAKCHFVRVSGRTGRTTKSDPVGLPGYEANLEYDPAIAGATAEALGARSDFAALALIVG